jgi:glycosyltransferase involved in cell wall biosynthesis
MPTAPPLVSIIVPTFNRAPFLERCLRSVLTQDYPRLECIVVDGASRDASVAILERIALQDPRLRFVSEPDCGEVDATNKGMDLARGDIMGVLASDDAYVPGAVRTSVQFMVRHPEHVGVSGDGRYVDEQGRDLGRGVITYRGQMCRDTIRRMLILRYKMCPVYHAAFFGWRHRILAIGRMDPRFSVIPDFEFYLRLLDAGASIGCLPRVQVAYTVHPDMGAIKHHARVEAQRAELHRRHGLRWHHEFLRLTVGRLASYLANPYRSPFIPGLRRELTDWIARRRQSKGCSP